MPLYIESKNAVVSVEWRLGEPQSSIAATNIDNRLLTVDIRSDAAMKRNGIGLC